MINVFYTCTCNYLFGWLMQCDQYYLSRIYSIFNIYCTFSVLSSTDKNARMFRIKLNSKEKTMLPKAVKRRDIPQVHWQLIP